MAREVIFKTWCDLCLARDEQTEGQEIPPLLLPEIPGKQAVVVALCEVHRKEVYDPLVAILQEYGQHVDEHGNPTGPRGKYKAKPGSPAAAVIEAVPDSTCPLCGKEMAHRGSVNSHLRNSHGTTRGEVEGQKSQHECPECHRMFQLPQALGSHRKRAHGVEGAKSKAKADA